MIGFQCLVVLIGVAACVYWSAAIVEGKAQCQARETLTELLAQALAAALAFAGGWARRGDEGDDSKG